MLRHSIINIQLDYQGNEISRRLSAIETYNSDGYLVDEIHLDEKENIITKKIYQYHEGNLVRESEYYPKEGLSHQENWSKEFQEGEDFLHIMEFNSGSKLIRSFEYKEDSNTYIWTISDENQQLVGRELYFFNEQNQNIRVVEQEKNGEVTNEYLKIFDKEGRMIQLLHFYHQEQQFIQTIVYNEQENPVEETTKYTDGSIHISLFEYNEKGLLNHKKEYRNEILTFSNQISYNEQDQIAEELVIYLDPWRRDPNLHEKIVHEYENS